ncbi:MBL fold metallo-hydrolase [Thiolapillus brandeum]|uniref:Beta-lactamase domain protein n=1 Tax=Thiolapillus brandeum TaxID=1076588 RepID=A0A7U6GJV0_9GAMM|nr:MBL fold metallo-hydrolase [Thiolapillus brandeum]BAO45018.1 beta-lactamase domain protein [Thiolapillus brandeum]
MRFASLGSGSRGNATLIQAGGTCLLLDCGFSLRELEARMARLKLRPDSLDAVLVTHEHGDHIKGVGPLARKYGTPVWMTHGTWRNAPCGDVPELQLFGSHTPAFQVGEIQVRPFAVPHDAREPTQFTFSHDGLTLGILTDTGSFTPHVLDAVADVDGLLLECNHDVRMLRDGPYPPRLQARVGGDYGHLSNDQAAALLSHIHHQRLQHLVLGHLSEQNNCPKLARRTLAAVSQDLDARISVLEQAGGSDWFRLA